MNGIVRHFAAFIPRMLDASWADPDERRRARLLNILLAAGFIISILALLATVGFQLSGEYEQEAFILLYGGAGVLALGIVGIYLVNRHWSGRIASGLFVLLLVIILSFSDAPIEVADGRSLVFLAIPVVVASVILPPYYSFVVAVVVSGVVVVLLVSLGQTVTPFAPFAFVFVAIVSFLSGRSIDRALAQLRTINRELDWRVQERTKDLASANEQLSAANDRLRELDRLKSRFVSTVSHELRTPLSAIIGFVEMLTYGVYGPLNDAQQEPLERVMTNARMQLNLVNSLLDRAQIEAGTMSLRSEPLEPAQLIEDMMATMRVLAKSKGLELAGIVDSDVPGTLYGDRQRLNQILVNLANNAVKFTDKGYVIVHIYRPSVDRWAIDVTDTGPGIPMEAQGYIFEPFRQVDDSRGRRSGGVGLGLSIVQQLVELMAGEITVKSQIDQGTTFTITLPVVHERGS